MNFKTEFNEQGQNFTTSFTGTLVSLQPEFKENSNGKSYRLGTVKFVNAHAQEITTTCAVYKANLDLAEAAGTPMAVGNQYLCNAQITSEGKAYINVSHLTSAPTATADDFGFDVSEFAKVGVGQEEVNQIQ